METKDFIIELEKKDMKLWLNEEGGLAFKGPKNFMTDDLLNQIKERKEEIVECLKRERFIKHDEKGKYLQFPLNDMQSAYYSGMKRIYELGGTSCYTYLELEVPQIDVLKLEQAWHQVIAKHDMLRAIVSKDGMQQILDCHVIDEGKCLKINWDVREHIFNEHVIRKMLSAFQTLLKEMGTSEKVWEEKNPIKCDGESINIRERKNATDKKYVPHMLYEGFLKQITERSENIAIIHDHQKYSYRDLEGYVGGIQKRLLEMGVGHGDYVAIIMPRSALQIASVLAVSLLGGIFVPLDYEQPIARQKNILRNLNPKVILLNSENKELQGDCVANTINLLQDNLEKQKIYVNSDNKVSDYAYVIYTSGTTGQPKGVVMSHKAVANTIDGINERFCVNNGSTFLGLSKLAFDLSIYDIFGCFDVGGTLVLPNETKAKNPEHWIELVYCIIDI